LPKPIVREVLSLSHGHGLEDQLGDELRSVSLGIIEGRSARQDGGKFVVTTRVTGTFLGSPVELNFAFTLDGNKIMSLTIGD
jgi:hypothetical protein